MIFILLAFLLFGGTEAFAGDQRDSLANVYGSVVDADFLPKQRNAVHGANVLLVRSDGGRADSLYTAVSFPSGSFTFKNIPPQRVYMKVFCVGSETISGWYDLEPGRNVFLFSMERKKEELKEATVTAEIPLVRHSGDTTIYNASAVRTMDDESARAMLAQLPGFELKDDRIIVDGQEVRRTYVNGALIFGDLPTTAIDALKAGEVAQVRVYDEQEDVDRHRGLAHSRKSRVLDITTKSAFMSLSEALVHAEGGADDTGQGRYDAIGSAAYHSEMLQLSATAIAQNMSRNYTGQMGLTPSKVRSISGEVNVPLSRYNENNDIVLGGTRYWKDRNYGNKIDFEYKMSREYSRDGSRTYTEHFPSGDFAGNTVSDTLATSGNGKSHNLRLDLDLSDTPLKSINTWLVLNLQKDRSAA